MVGMLETNEEAIRLIESNVPNGIKYAGIMSSIMVSMEIGNPPLDGEILIDKLIEHKIMPKEAREKVLDALSRSKIKFIQYDL